MDTHLFHKSLHMAGRALSQVKQADSGKPTPCSEWDVRALANHIINELAWVEPLLAGKTIAEVGNALDGDLVGDNPRDAWQKYCAEASKAVMNTEPTKIVHLSYADKSAGAYVDEVAADIIVHGWDLAQALAIEYVIDEETASAVIESTKDLVSMARESGLIGAAITTSENASAADRLLASYGRTAKWRQLA